jgi:peptidoglycan biosynthesis protein MviN/MurJ (putative lipid II flippase)
MGVALAVAAYRTAATEEVLALAGGTLLGGVFAITYLLAARGRTGIAAAVAIAPPLLTPALKTLAAGLLPDAVGALAVTHVAGLLAVALTARDHRRAP